MDGFDDYNTRVRQSNGFSLPNPPRDEQAFDTPSGKAVFTVHDLPDVQVPRDHYVLMTLRSHDQYNTTVYGLHDRYRGVHGRRRVLFMNANDMVKRGWKSRQIVSITSHFNAETRHADDWMLVPYDIPEGNLAAYFPEANCLVPAFDSRCIEHANVQMDCVYPLSRWLASHGGKSDGLAKLRATGS